MRALIRWGYIIFSTVSLFAHAQELESLEQYIHRKPLFISDKNDTLYVASRCSALYLVLSTRIEEAAKTKDLKSTIKEYEDRAVTFNQVRTILSKATGSSVDMSMKQQKDFAKTYADLTLRNWKYGGDIFSGIIEQDFGVCRDNFPDFKKLAINLSKDN